MIDTDFILRYTDALYRTAPENSPRYDEFRDMLSAGQIHSKLWLIRELVNLRQLDAERVVILGAWFATLAFLLKIKFPKLHVVCVDIDKRCPHFIKNLVRDDEAGSVTSFFSDVSNYEYSDESIIINTSCEHIPNTSGWLKKTPPGRLIVLQSINNESMDGHINCVHTLDEFKSQVAPDLDEIYFAGELELPMYTRFMIIGKTK